VDNDDVCEFVFEVIGDRVVISGEFIQGFVEGFVDREGGIGVAQRSQFQEGVSLREVGALEG
jgi:hypothetical protein